MKQQEIVERISRTRGLAVDFKMLRIQTTKNAGAISKTLRMIALISTSLLMFAGASSQPSGSQDDGNSFEALERAVWTADEASLPDIEKKVVRLVQVAPYSAKAHYLLSRVFFRFYSENPANLHLLKQASDLAEQAIELDRTDDVGYIALADVLDLMGQTTKGLLLLDQAIFKGVQPSWRLYFTKARLYADGLNTARVLSLLEDALACKDADPDIIVPYVVAVFQTSKQGNALTESLENWSEKFPHRFFDESLAAVYAQNSEYDKAHKKYQLIQKRFPDNKEAMINDAVLLYKHLNQPKVAQKLLVTVLEKQQSKLSPMLSGVVHAHLGAVNLKLGQYAKAEQYFLKALQKSSGQSATIDFMTSAYKEAKQPKHFVGLLKKVTNEISGVGILYALLGESLSEDLKLHAEALIAFENATILEPERSDFKNGMGLVFYRMNRYQSALKLFREAIALDPSDATAHYNEACILARLGHEREALAALQEAFVLDPRLRSQARDDHDFASLANNSTFKQLLNGSIDGVPGEQGLPAH